jgi:hypothetical protein
MGAGDTIGSYISPSLNSTVTFPVIIRPTCRQEYIVYSRESTTLKLIMDGNHTQLKPNQAQSNLIEHKFARSKRKGL